MCDTSKIVKKVSKFQMGDEEITDTLDRIIKLAKQNPKFYNTYKEYLDPEEIHELGIIQTEEI